MPMQRPPQRRDGHDDHLNQLDDVDTRYPSTPRRVPRTNPARFAPTTDAMSDEDVTRAGVEYDTQGIITLEPKIKQRQTGSYATPTRQPSNRLAPQKQPTQQSIAVRQPTQPRNAIRQSTQAREAVRQPSQSRDALRQSTQAREAVRQTTQPRAVTKQSSQQLRAARPTSQNQKRQYHWLVPTGVTLMITIACYLLLYTAWTGGRGMYNNWAYGSTTRTSHLEAVVGDHDSITSPTHFVAMNLHGNIDVIELPGGDITHAKAFPGPHLLWTDADKAVVTLEVKDVNGDNKPDIIVHIQGDTDLLFRQTTANFVMHNNGSGFAPMTAFQS